MMDSLIVMLNSRDRNKNGNDIYYFARSISPPANIFPNDGTIQQLKAGSLRLIRKKIVIDSIIKYDAVVKSLLRLDEQEQSIINIQRETAPAIFIGVELGKFSDADNIPQRLELKPPLVPGYKNSLNEFNYRLVSLKNVNKGYRRESRKLLAQAVNLLNTLKTEYHLK